MKNRNSATIVRHPGYRYRDSGMTMERVSVTIMISPSFRRHFLILINKPTRLAFP
jgi:hypothetical protein